MTVPAGRYGFTFTLPHRIDPAEPDVQVRFHYDPGANGVRGPTENVPPEIEDVRVTMPDGTVEDSEDSPVVIAAMDDCWDHIAYLSERDE